MPVIVFDILDAGIRAARSDAEGLLRVDGQDLSSPGAALVDNGSITTGVDAASQSCVRPSVAWSRFWQQLDTEPIDPRDPRSSNRAEVACAHLESIARSTLRPGDEAVFAVPASYTDGQLGILVAIARDLQIPLRGLVPRPIGFEPPEGSADTFLVVDVGLHQCVLTVVNASDPADDGEGSCITMLDSRMCPDVGLDTFRRRWIKAIGREFLRTTRFDPLHDAASEQQLHQIISDVVATVGPAHAEVLELRASKRSYQITVTDRLLSQAAQDLVLSLTASVRTSIDSDSISAIVVSGGAGRIPGLQDALAQQTALPVHVLEPGAVALGLARLWPDHFDPPREDGVGYYTRRRAPAPMGSSG